MAKSRTGLKVAKYARSKESEFVKKSEEFIEKEKDFLRKVGKM